MKENEKDKERREREREMLCKICGQVERCISTDGYEGYIVDGLEQGHIDRESDVLPTGVKKDCPGAQSMHG